MNCIECKATNPDSSRYCGQCGAELGRTLDETIRKKGFRDRQATEMEITESVVSRLMKWTTWLGGVTTFLALLFGLFLGKEYRDVGAAVEAGKTKIETSVRDATTEIGEVKHATAGVGEELKGLQSDVEKYKKVDLDIAKLQKKLTDVQGQVIDLGNRELKAAKVSTTGRGPSSLGFGHLGCPPSPEEGVAVAYCAKGSPLSLFQVPSTGEPRPVSSFSPVGFQDVSVAPKPACNLSNRGTFYVEKGAGGLTDKPFLCAKKSDNTYAWIQLGIVP